MFAHPVQESCILAALPDDARHNDSMYFAFVSHPILAHALSQFMTEIDLRVDKPIQILSKLGVHRI